MAASDESYNGIAAKDNAKIQEHNINMVNSMNSSDVSCKCGCQCGVLAAELDGVKLELVILQKSVEIKIIEVKSHEDEVT